MVHLDRLRDLCDHSIGLYISSVSNRLGDRRTIRVSFARSVSGKVSNPKELIEILFRYYFFDASESPLFELCYLINMAKLAYVVLAFLAVDIMFIEVCFYILAMYQELRAMLRQLKQVGGGYSRTRHQLLECIRLHAEIVE